MKKGLNPAKVTAIYGALGVAWILGTEWFAGRWNLHDHLPFEASVAKGMFYIILTSVLLYALIRLIERRLEHERAWYRELFESNPQPMWVYDLATLKFLEVNRAAVLHYGYSREEFLTMSLPDIRPVEDVPALLASVARAREGADHFGIWRHRKKDGSEIRVEVFSHRSNFLGRRSKMVLAQDVTERLRAEERLRESEARFREMAENTGDIYYNYDPVNDRLLYANENFVRVWGRPLETAYADPMSYLDGIHPEDRPAADEADVRQRRGEPTDTEYRVVRPDGGVTWIQDRSRSLTDASGAVYRIVGTMRDITARKRVEAALRESQGLLRIAARVSRLGGWSIDLAESGPVIIWSDEVCILHGVTPGYRPDMDTAFGFFAPEHRATIYNAIETCIKERRDFDEELEIVTADGRRVAVRAMGEAVVDPQGKVVRVQGALQDVTERKEAEYSLVLSQQRYYQLADSMPFMVWTADAGGRIDFANRAFTHYTGIPSDERLGERWLGAVHPDDVSRCLAVWQEAAATGEPYEMEFRILRRAGGDHRWHKLTGTAIRDEEGNVVKWYGTALDVHEIKLAEERANDLARRLTKTLESITDAFLTMDRNWRFTYVNHEAERMLGRARGELLGRDMWTEFPDVSGSDFERHYRHALESGETTAFEAYYPPPIDKWFAVRAYPSAHGLAVYFRDVTKARLDAQRQRENEERLRLVSRATNDLIWDFDAVTGMIWWGEGFEKFFGPAPENRMTDEAFWEERVHPDDRARAITGVERAFRGGGDDWSDEYRIRRADGSYVYVLDRGFVLRDASGKAVRMIGGLTDLTDRKRAEEDLRRLANELAREREKLVVAQNVAKLGSWETDLLTLEVSMSEESYRIHGLDPATYVPTHAGIFALIHPDDRERVEEAFADSVGKDGAHMIVHKMLLPDGSVRHVEQNWRIERDAAGRPLRAVGTTQDITARVGLEEQFRQAQKMEAIGRLAGGVAHDFNNMLTVILVRAEQAAKKLDPSNPLRATLKEIHDAAERSAGLTRQLLTYARRQAAEPRIVNLNESIGAMQQMLRRLIGEDIALGWVPGESLWPTRIDPAQVDQILANLCVNARDAIRDVGRIVIETQNASLDADYCRNRPGHRPGDYVMIVVSDNGAGMDAETRAHVFEPFFTTKEVGKGTGLGLATVYGIVQQNNGFIHVYSEPGEGTTFRIYLPRLATADAGGPVASPRGEAPRGSGETVLVVEDESMILEVAVEILEGLGYKVLATTAPADALTIVSEHKGAIDLLLTDVIMPGMNGRDLAGRIRAMRPGLRVLYMSGYTANVIVTRGLVDQGDAFVQKPFSTDELAARVRALLDAAG